MSGEADHMAAKLSDLQGKRLSAFRKSYQRMAHVHFGQMSPRARVPEKAVYKDHGEFIVDMLDCDRAVEPSSGGSLTSLADGDDHVFEAMAALEGEVVSTVSLEAESLTLRIEFVSGGSLTLVGDAEVGPENEQWAVTFPDRTVLMAVGRSELRVEPAGSP
jgi:hypothetical protein